ncbi:hypothetical protein M433DRAFT_148737 [Acidomyces richmondensis BFW]|nr:MAG: hypothetical protein FE78DRAFT_90830 [Acidomyces sp. 'richmondensis']KYG50617.1 hypothetical protein M433DRAFT_148737 [Acidomyces richmondensis BFW]
MVQKRAFNEGRRHFKKSKKQKVSTVSDGSNEEVLLADIRRLLQNTKSAGHEVKALPQQWTEVELEITELSSTGDGLAEKDGQIYVVPFAAPGDTVSAKVVKHFASDSYFLTDFVSVKVPSPHRTETPACRYFTQCSGCQFQHLSYAYQLAHKKTIVEKAYANFSNLPASVIPPVGDTIGSPLQYAYRTKLTPHFDAPPGARSDKRKGLKVKWDTVPPIGFMQKGTRKTIDIEECPIGTKAVQLGLKRERARVQKDIETYQRGATLLLRESTERVKKDHSVAEDMKEKSKNEDAVTIIEDRGDYQYRKTCITDFKAVSTEYVDDYRFDNPAGSFFQNNNSILPEVTEYIRTHILAQPINEPADNKAYPQIKNMIDAYCGSGFFTITLSKMFSNSIGIDISPQSIDSASHNAKINKLPANSTRFIAADANDLFSSIDTSKIKPSETAVVIDPPRKGCDQGFIKQLIGYGPARICYVSCNVHTQARDVGWLVGGMEDDEGLPMSGMYEIESLRGFDFFPQTSHVEGVAILKKRSGSLTNGARAVS